MRKTEVGSQKPEVRSQNKIVILNLFQDLIQYLNILPWSKIKDYGKVFNDYLNVMESLYTQSVQISYIPPETI